MGSAVDFGGGFSSQSVDLHRVTPVGGVQFGNIAVEVASTRWMPPRWPFSTLYFFARRYRLFHQNCEA